MASEFPSAKKRREERLVWIDCEMTGLDAQKDTLLEVAVIVTEGDLSIVAEGPNLGWTDGFPLSFPPHHVKNYVFDYQKNFIWSVPDGSMGPYIMLGT